MSKKKHVWKICPAGSYYVKAHYKTINGKEHYWKAHCRKGKGKKEVLTSDEIHAIAVRFKDEKLKMPKAYDFKVKGKLGNKYDLIIAGWVRYWSDIFGNKTNITVDFVKILIMTESTFGNKALGKIKNTKLHAIGLMQITDYTFKLIKEDQKELRNHVFSIKRDYLYDPNINICVGVRWLFRKREIAKYYLKKEPTPLELAEEYKGIRNDKSPAANIQRKHFKDRSHEYKKSNVN